MALLVIKPTSDELSLLIERVVRAIDPGVEIAYRTPQTRETSQNKSSLEIVQATGEILKGCDSRALNCILGGGNTYMLSYGDNWRSPRWHIIEISRRLRKITDSENPFSLIARKKKIQFHNGSYKGVEYAPTLFGYFVYIYMIDKGYLPKEPQMILKRHKETLYWGRVNGRVAMD